MVWQKGESFEGKTQNQFCSEFLRKNILQAKKSKKLIRKLFSHYLEILLK
jgi:dimeric dUTPase (all-alpha-NTP-PPase superfamily)